MYVYKKFEFYRFQSLSNKRKDNETGDDVVIGGPRVSSADEQHPAKVYEIFHIHIYFLMISDVHQMRDDKDLVPDNRLKKRQRASVVLTEKIHGTKKCYTDNPHMLLNHPIDVLYPDGQYYRGTISKYIGKKWRVDFEQGGQYAYLKVDAILKSKLYERVCVT